MVFRCALPTLLAGLSLTCSSAATGRQLPRYDLATRVEVHMLPAVSTGPLDPVWSPDGEWIAFSMRGDIWRIPAHGGAAVAVTRGPGYHFEPAWSPTGHAIAFTTDVGGNLDIHVAPVAGGAPVRLTRDPGVDVQPVWTPDGQHVLFTSSRNGNLDVFRVPATGGVVAPVITGRGHQFQPAVSPDGADLVYVSPVRGRMGSGGLWRRSLSGGDPVLVHYEETSYRPRPRWTPDGRSIVFASDAAGSYDLARIPADGGNRVRLTHQPLDEFAPAISPDGRQVVFVSNRSGPTTLFTMSAAGGSKRQWQEIEIQTRQSATPTGTLRATVRDEHGNVVPARLMVLASDGRGYTPDGGFHRVSPANEIHYFHSNGASEVAVPVGQVVVEATRGFEYLPVADTVTITADRTTDVLLRLTRLIDAPAMGWYSGDTHVHDLHEGRYGLDQWEFYDQFVADDLHVANALIHMDGTKLMGRWSDLTGRQFPGSRDDYILRYAEEFRGSLGHVGLLGIEEFVMPLIAGAGGSPFAADVLKLDYLDAARTQGGIAGYLHPYNGNVSDVRVAAQSDIPIHTALGRGEFFDVVSIASDELASAAMYYRMLNSGLRIAATGGTDNFSNVWRDPSGGTARTYAWTDGPLSFDRWIEAVRRGRTFATNGPLLMATVDGALPGSTLTLTGNLPLTVNATVATITPVHTLEVIANGQVVHTIRPEPAARRFSISHEVALPAGGWVAVRVVGDRHRFSGDNYVFAHTTPVYVVRNERPFTSAADARFLIETIDEIWRRVEERDAWRTEREKAAYRNALEEAKRVYRRSARADTLR